jgi:hypothetical protein
MKILKTYTRPRLALVHHRVVNMARYNLCKPQGAGKLWTGIILYYVGMVRQKDGQ